MEQRYTTKKFDASKKIEPAKIEELKEILRLTPSSINGQPWKFTFVSDPATKAQLAEASFFNAPKVNNSDTLVVFSRIENIALFEELINEHLPAGAVGYYKDYLKGKPARELHTWFDKQVYIAIGVLLSACAEMNIDATPMEGIEPEKYNAVLGDTDHSALVGVCIGYRDAEDKNQPSMNPKSRMPLDKVVRSI